MLNFVSLVFTWPNRSSRRSIYFCFKFKFKSLVVRDASDSDVLLVFRWIYYNLCLGHLVRARIINLLNLYT